jgi:hypothetical protein
MPVGLVSRDGIGTGNANHGTGTGRRRQTTRTEQRPPLGSCRTHRSARGMDRGFHERKPCTAVRVVHVRARAARRFFSVSACRYTNYISIYYYT